MRKLFVISLATLVLLAFISAPVFAQCSQSGNKEEKAAQAVEGTETRLVDAKDIKDCAYKCTTPCEGHQGKCAMVDMSIKGMTCGSCETTIKTALEKVPGVLKVQSISHKDGLAHVCFDPDKANLEGMTKAVVDKGYEAQIVPAVARTTEVTGEAKAVDAKTGCNLPCPAKATCASKSASTTQKDKGDGTK